MSAQFHSNRIIFPFWVKFSWNEETDTCFSDKCILLGRNYDFLGRYLVATARYLSVTTRYLVVTSRYCSFQLLV